MTAKKSKAPRPPLFPARKPITAAVNCKTGEGWEAFAAWAKTRKSVREILGEIFESMDAAAHRVLADPDDYSTDDHEHARLLLGKLDYLNRVLDGPEEALLGIIDALHATEAWMSIRANVVYSKPVSQVRRRNAALDRNRPKRAPKHTDDEVRAVLRDGGTIKAQAKKLGYSPAQITILRKRFPNP